MRKSAGCSKAEGYGCLMARKGCPQMDAHGFWLQQKATAWPEGEHTRCPRLLCFASLGPHGLGAFWGCCLNFLREWPNGFQGFGAWLLASGSMAAEHCMACLHGFEAVFHCLGSMKEKHNIAWDGQIQGSLEHNAWVGLYCYSEHGHMAFGLWVLGSGFC